jgi:hypothetical protein
VDQAKTLEVWVVIQLVADIRELTGIRWMHEQNAQQLATRLPSRTQLIYCLPIAHAPPR